MKHGFLLIDKPVGPTSHDVVSSVRRVLHEKDVGHLGTLDPQASGLLVLAVGAKALKVIEFFTDLRKEYLAGIRFGAISTTYDAAGVIESVTPNPGVKEPDHHAILRIIQDKFTGSFAQRPPDHSAVHINGQRAYDLARKGKTIDMPTRQVTVQKCDIVSFDYPDLELRVACSSGTYIRSLAHDLGQVLRCGAYLAALRRTVVGEWKIENGVSPEDAEWAHVIALKDILKDRPGIAINDAEWEHVRNGRPIAQHIKEETFAWHEELPVAVLKPIVNGARARKVL